MIIMLICFDTFTSANTKSLNSLKLPPNHLVHNTHVALNNLHDLGRYILVHIIRYRKTMVPVLAEFNGGIYGLKQGVFVDAGDDEVGFVDGFGTFGAGADADGGEGVTD